MTPVKPWPLDTPETSTLVARGEHVGFQLVPHRESFGARHADFFQDLVRFYAAFLN